MTGTQGPTARLYARLKERAPRGVELGLDRVNAALDACGRPDATFPIVHVAGTNGKGSVCAMVESVAREAGLKTGLFTSPHLSRLTERVRIDGTPIAAAAFAPHLDAALSAVDGGLTFFEALTVAGALAMADAAVDLAVVEVGLGGRLDSTNALQGVVCSAVVTIALDHEKQLGATLEAIAAEKAAIARAGTPLVRGVLPDEAAAVVAQITKRQGARLLSVGRTGTEADATFDDAGEELVLRLPDGSRLEAPAVGLAGPHQRHNAAVAATIAWAVRERFPELLGAVGAGVAAARWPGRLETLDVRGVPVVLDGAHNLAACEALIAALDDDGAVANQLVFGALADKQAEPMLRRLATAVDARHYCEPLAPVGARRSVPTDALAAVAPGRAHASPEEAIEAAVDAARQRPGGRVLVTGSLFLVGRVRAHLLGEEREMEVPL